LLPEVTERVWEGRTRAWPSSPTCPAASCEGFCSACGFEPCFDEPDPEDDRSLLGFLGRFRELDFFELDFDFFELDFLLVAIFSAPPVTGS